MVTFDMFYFIVREQPLSLLFRCQNYRPFSIYFVSFLTERLFSNKTIVFLKICPKKSYVQLKTNVCEKAYSKNPSFRNQILLENQISKFNGTIFNHSFFVRFQNYNFSILWTIHFVRLSIVFYSEQHPFSQNNLVRSQKLRSLKKWWSSLITVF